ncbi:MAG: hypothetical protein GY796_35250 [Chloroflexi bacterium]|nr:hypothetical protein [Chloroflexota bacterium]
MLMELISRVRRNHGLEHASIHVLSEKHKNFSAQGNSTPSGFNLNIYGDVSETNVIEAVEEAYTRLKKGEHNLAVHPNCGTVLLTTAVMATLAAQTVFVFEQKKQRRNSFDPMVLLNALPTAILAVVAALIISRPIGVQLQARYTVEGDLQGLQILRIRKVAPSPITRFFQLLLTGGRAQATSYRIDTKDK